MVSLSLTVSTRCCVIVRAPGPVLCDVTQDFILPLGIWYTTYKRHVFVAPYDSACSWGENYNTTTVKKEQ